MDCGTCQYVCPVVNGVECRKPIEVFAVYSKDGNDRNSSASGGASSVFAS